MAYSGVDARIGTNVESDVYPLSTMRAVTCSHYAITTRAPSPNHLVRHAGR